MVALSPVMCRNPSSAYPIPAAMGYFSNGVGTLTSTSVTPCGAQPKLIFMEAESMAGVPAVPDMRLELVPIPVSDVDRAKAFYEQVGFENQHDTQVTNTMRVVQLTPPGSSCAIVFGTGMGPITDMTPGSLKGIHLVVEDMSATRAALIRAWHRAQRHR